MEGSDGWLGTMCVCVCGVWGGLGGGEDKAAARGYRTDGLSCCLSAVFLSQPLSCPPLTSAFRTVSRAAYSLDHTSCSRATHSRSDIRLSHSLTLRHPMLRRLCCSGVQQSWTSSTSRTTSS
eukprot:2999033-Rhodomonas_salina.3